MIRRRWMNFYELLSSFGGSLAICYLVHSTTPFSLSLSLFYTHKHTHTRVFTIFFNMKKRNANSRSINKMNNKTINKIFRKPAIFVRFKAQKSSLACVRYEAVLECLYCCCLLFLLLLAYYIRRLDERRNRKKNNRKSFGISGFFQFSVYLLIVYLGFFLADFCFI